MTDNELYEQQLLDTFKAIVVKLEKMSWLAKRNNKSLMKDLTSSFNIRGTRFWFIIHYIAFGKKCYAINWYLSSKKRKGKNNFVASSSLSDVLESNLLSVKAREGLLFNLDIFN